MFGGLYQRSRPKSPKNSVLASCIVLDMVTWSVGSPVATHTDSKFVSFSNGQVI